MGYGRDGLVGASVACHNEAPDYSSILPIKLESPMNQSWFSMLIAIVRCAAFALAAMLAMPASAAVIKLSIPGGEVRDIVYSTANSAFAATQGGGIYTSVNAGQTWSHLAASPARYVNQLAIGSTGTLYAATTAGVFSSSDGGGGWTRLFGDRVSAIAVQPGTDNTVLFGVPGAGVYRIIAGAAPVLSASGLGNTGISSIAFDPQTPTTAYLGVTSPCQDSICTPQDRIGVYKSTDSGATWTDITANLDVKFVTGITVTNDHTVFVSTRTPSGCGPGGANLLLRGAGNWLNPTVEGAGMVSGAETVKLDRLDGNSVWVGSCGIGLYRATFSAGHWTFARQHVPGNPPVDLLNAAYAIGSYAGSDRVSVAVRGAGIFTSASGRNGGSTAWSEASGLNALRATSFDVLPANAATMYIGSVGAGVLSSTNSGNNWNRFNTGFPNLAAVAGVPTLLDIRGVVGHPTDSTKVAAIAGGFGGFPAGVYQASAGTWSQVPGTSGGGVYLNPQGLVYSAGDDSLLVSNFDNQYQAGVFVGSGTTGGYVQRLPETGYGKIFRSQFPATKLFVLSSLPDNSVNASYGIGVRSTNGGLNWAWMSAPGHAGFMSLVGYALAERDANNLLASTNKGLFGSADGGATWSRITVSGTATTVFSGLAYSGTNVFAVSRAGGFFCSTNNGATWSDLSATLPESPVFVDLQARGSQLYLVSDGAGVLLSSAPTCP